MSEFAKRTLFGAVYVVLVVTSLLFFRPYYFQLIFLLVSTFAVREFHKITNSDVLLTLCGMILSWLMFSAVSLFACTSYYLPSVYLACLYGLVLMLAIVSELFKKADNPIRNWGLLLAGQVMVALPFALMNVLFAHSNMLLLCLFILIWLNDTGAYCVGSLIGKHKMFNRVSPGKSWEGFVGGTLFTMLAGWLFLSDPLHLELQDMNYHWWQSLLIAMTVVVFGTLGDLIESLTKRTLGIKDSGNVIPGHGGLLDRFDSILLATPAVTLVCLLMMLM